eukprot:1795001-Alexandrium_andersonii.AAC.1
MMLPGMGHARQLRNSIGLLPFTGPAGLEILAKRMRRARRTIPCPSGLTVVRRRVLVGRRCRRTS